MKFNKAPLFMKRRAPEQVAASAQSRSSRQKKGEAAAAAAKKSRPPKGSKTPRSGASSESRDGKDDQGELGLVGSAVQMSSASASETKDHFETRILKPIPKYENDPELTQVIFGQGCLPNDIMAV